MGNLLCESVLWNKKIMSFAASKAKTNIINLGNIPKPILNHIICRLDDFRRVELLYENARIPQNVGLVSNGKYGSLL